MYQDRSWIEIDLTHYRHNLRELTSLLPEGTGFMQIVKADAYGHGAFEIAKQAQAAGASMLGVANADEGALLRYQGIKLPILILSPSLSHEIPSILENDLTVTVAAWEFAQELNLAAATRNQKVLVHVKVDTGMNRNGVPSHLAPSFIQDIERLPNLILEGVYSHFAASENDQEHTEAQYKAFTEVLSAISRQVTYVHIANSAAACLYPFPATNLVRLGLMSFGVYPDEALRQRVMLKPVMRFKTRISLIKNIEAGDCVGYNRTFVAPQAMQIAVAPVGYADGYDFMLSNKGMVRIQGKPCKVIGKISMDMITVDVSHLENPTVGEEMTFLGDLDESTHAENLCRLYGGNPYELLCQLGRRAKHYYLLDNRQVSSSPLLRRDFVSHDFSDRKLTTIIESALSQRLQSDELSNLILQDFLKMFFFHKDKDVHYRHDFRHHIRFTEAEDVRMKDYFRVETTISYRKVLGNAYFTIACANAPKVLDRYFRQTDVEYRWLLDEGFHVTRDLFSVTSARINEIPLNLDYEVKDGCLEIGCHHPLLATLQGTEVVFAIATQTYYPRNTHQLGVYINDLTQGIDITFEHPSDLLVQTIPIFAGQNKFPAIIQHEDRIEVRSNKEEWIFPQSGIIFVY